jgi:hypothetical protein
MTEFPFVTWACKYALVVGSLAIERERVIYHATHFCPPWVIATVRRPHVSLLDMRHPIGVASRRSSLSHFPLRRLLDNSIRDSLHLASFRVAKTCVASSTGNPSKVTGHANRSFMTSNPNLDPYRLHSDVPSNPDSPQKGGAYLSDQHTLHIKTGPGALSA